MRVSFVLGPAVDHPVGGYTVAYSYANELARRGHQTTVVHSFTGSQRNEPWGLELGRDVRRRARGILIPWFELEPSVRVRLVPILHRATLPFADATIFGPWQTVHDMIGSPPRNAIHLVYDYEFWRSRSERERARMRAAFRRPGVVRLAGSAAVREMLVEAGSSADGVLTCGLDHDRFHCTREQAERPLLVGFPLRPERHKAMPVAFTAAARIAAAVPGVRIAAFGNGTPAPPPPVQALGRLSDAELVEFYNECAVFMLPSDYEGWGLPAVEAMACGAAVVTTANGGTADFALDDHTALVVPTRSPDALADAVVRLLRELPLRERISDAGSRATSGMSWDAATDRLLAVIAGDHTVA
jgi:L-malate glycosyltransferase